MSGSDYEKIDAALLSLSEARERAEQAAKSMRDSGAAEQLVSTIEQIDRELLALHGQLMDAAYFEGRGEPKTEVQLSLSA